jgi:hypothetical protein
MQPEYHANMVSKKRPSAYTISAHDPIPSPPGHEITHELRAPPKVYFPYRDSNGISPAKIQRMIEQQRQYEEDCENYNAQTEIAAFEARQNGHSLPVPSLPIPPKIDSDVLRSFEPPSATRFYEYQSPTIVPVAVKNAKMPRPVIREMSRGCPACNPDHCEEIMPNRRPATRNGRRIDRERHHRPIPKRDELPLQLNQAYWMY